MTPKFTGEGDDEEDVKKMSESQTGTRNLKTLKPLKIILETC